MTVEEALQLRAGDQVCHAAAVAYTPSRGAVKRPLRVTEVWIKGVAPVAAPPHVAAKVTPRDEKTLDLFSPDVVLDSGAPLRPLATPAVGGSPVVMLRLASIAKDAWLPATEYELPPHGMLWDREASEWVTPDQMRLRKLARKQ